jgi:hypothetical protein
MPRIRSTTVLLAVAALTVLAGCGSDKTKGKEQTLKLTEPGGNAGNFAPIGKITQNKVPAGSGFAISIPLQDSSKKNVGEINATCIGTKPSKGQTLQGTCSGTALVPGGTLALNVGGAIGDNITGAITGGTGKYEGASGTFTSKQTGGGGDAPNDDTFTITLP